MGKGKGRPEASEPRRLWNTMPSDMHLFLKDVMHMCVYVYIYVLYIICIINADVC
jgi:hypothetical protein